MRVIISLFSLQYVFLNNDTKKLVKDKLFYLILFEMKKQMRKQSVFTRLVLYKMCIIIFVSSVYDQSDSFLLPHSLFERKKQNEGTRSYLLILASLNVYKYHAYIRLATYVDQYQDLKTCNAVCQWFVSVVCTINQVQ